jgi:hypothetical protein
MHTLRDLILLAAGVSGVAAGIHYWQSNRESMVTGAVVDLKTGRTVPHVQVFPKYLNGHGRGAETDDSGRFRLPLPYPTQTVGLFAEGDGYAGLFGKTLGFGGHWLRNGEKETGALVPAIPAAILSGSVHDEAGNPVPGCIVNLMRPTSLFGPLDIEPGVDETTTNALGMFHFARVDTGVYYPSADCNARSDSDHLFQQRMRDTPRADTAWKRTLYPSALTLKEAQPVILTSGQRREGLTIRVARARAFTVRGRFVWDDGDGPKPRDVYSNDFAMLSSDERYPQPVSCRWNTVPGLFDCYPVVAGVYRLSMAISLVWRDGDPGRGISTPNNQQGEIRLRIDAKGPPPEVLLPMHKVTPPPRPIPSTQKREQTGSLDIEITGCGSYVLPQMSIQVLRLRSFSDPLVYYAGETYARVGGNWKVPAGTYQVNATCTPYWGSRSNTYFSELLGRAGTRVEVRPDVTARVSVKGLSAEEVYRLAVRHLQHEAGSEMKRAQAQAAAILQ